MARTLCWMALLWACEADSTPDPILDPAPEARTQDIQRVDLSLDLAALTGQATFAVAPALPQGDVRLDVSGLDVLSVRVDGAAADATAELGELVVASDGDLVEIEVEYNFLARDRTAFDGWMPALGVTFVWPYYCQNLYPCDPSMDDGVVFTMEVTGVEPGLTAVYPTTTVSDGPAYMPALSVASYTKVQVGTTPSGTTISAWYFTDEGPQDTRAGTAHLVDVFAFFEETYGPYAFGDEYGSVEVNWGRDSWGGMEHHPYSHIGSFDMDDQEVHAHEAGHGWYGNGVRLACWEDFVLSEGTNSYITARAMEQVGGPDLWAYYVDDFLVPICRGNDVNTIVLRDTCNEIDFVNDDLWSLATYMKGACFYEDVADLIGPDLLDEVIGQFYRDNVLQTARMQEMIAAIEAVTQEADRAALRTLTEEWLLTEACPEGYAERCRRRR
jgi:aminopeptidase N